MTAKQESTGKLTKLEKYEGLMSLTQLTSSSLDYKNIQKKAETKISKLLNSEKVVIYTHDEKNSQLLHTFYKDSKVSDIAIDINEKTFVGSCAHYSALLHISDVSSDLRSKRSPKLFDHIKEENLLLVPMFSKGSVLGVIQVINSRNDEGFDEDDIYFAQAAANQFAMTLENFYLIKKLQNQFIQVVEALADAIGKKDAYTGGHTKRVRHFAEMIGKELSLPFEDMNNLRLAAVLHDIGKIGIEDKILKKDSPLTHEEFLIMKEHPRLGHEILGHIESLSDVVDGMRFHHERPDGKGYPFGLKGDEIPVIAMIISVADSFDAMISTRPYRKGLPPMVAWQEILDNSSTQFSQRVVEAFDKGFRKTKMYRPESSQKSKKAS